MRSVFGENLGIVLLYFSIKTYIVVLIRIALKVILMHAHQRFFVENGQNISLNYNQIFPFAGPLDDLRICSGWSPYIITFIYKTYQNTCPCIWLLKI